MDLRVQTSLIAAMLSLALAVNVLLRPRKRRAHWVFAMFGLSVGFWYTVTAVRAAFAGELWERLHLVAGVLVPLTALQFFRAFVEDTDERMRALNRFGWFGATLLVGGILTPYYQSVLVGSGLLVSVLLWAKGTYAPLDALRYGVFNVVSVATTTGYATADYLVWPVFAPVSMLLLSGVATSAGSTGCGIKMVRVLILLKQARREMTRLVHTRAVQPVRLGDTVVDHTVIFSVLAFMLVYGGTVIGLSMVLLLTDLDPVTAFTAVLASVHCMGPGLGAVGPSSNFAVLTDFQVWVCTLAMLLGRLEFLSVMALLAPSFWRR